MWSKAATGSSALPIGKSVPSKASALVLAPLSSLVASVTLLVLIYGSPLVPIPGEPSAVVGSRFPLLTASRLLVSSGIFELGVFGQSGQNFVFSGVSELILTSLR